MQLHHCILTAYQFDKSVVFEQPNTTIFTYTFLPVGKVIISLPYLIELKNNNQFRHPVLAGICRNAFENKEEPPLITRQFVDVELKQLEYPRTFKEKILHFLKFLYNKGGNEFKSFRYSTVADYPICYAEDPDQFRKMMSYLHEKDFIRFNDIQLSQGRVQYEDVVMTDDGIAEVEKELPKIPMIGLVDQTITTGDTTVDERINHAKKLFFEHPQTMDNMRSACETLSYVLEPLRKDLATFFSGKDVNDFFQLVNQFDIRHNKDHTKDLKHSEQLEWVFYSLLNTINIYTKLKNRLSS